MPQGPAPVPGVFPAGEKVAPSGNWDSGSMAFTSITRISRRAVPDTWTRPPVFCHAIFPCVLSNSGEASDPEISPLISARLTGDTTMRLTGTCLRLVLGGSRAPQATLHAVPRGAWRGCSSGLGIDGRLRLGEMEVQRQMRWHHVSRASPASQAPSPARRAAARRWRGDRGGRRGRLRDGIRQTCAGRLLPATAWSLRRSRARGGCSWAGP